MTLICQTSQDLWDQCLRRASRLVKGRELQEKIAEAIYAHGQDLLEAVYRRVSIDLSETQREGEEAWAADAYESVLTYLRPLIAEDIDAVLEHEEQCAKEQHEQAPEWAD